MNATFLRRGMLTATALLLATAAHAQQGRASTDPMRVPELKAEFERAAGLGLPTEPLVAQARKGFLMQGSAKGIRDGVRGLADRLVVAREALKPDRGTPELEAGALALQNDIPARVLSNLRQVQKARSLEVPLGILTELVSRGVPLERAATTVESMLKLNVNDTRMTAIATDVRGDVAMGVAPTVALDLRSKGVLSLPQPGLPGALAPATTNVRPPR